MKNPVIYLLKKMWKYAAGNRRNVVLYISMSMLANLAMALEPLIVGLFLNAVQTQGVNKANLVYLILLLCLLPLLEIVFWSLHGPSRVIENRNAFFVRASYKNYLLTGTMALPMEWHTDHHSGDTIDKIEKGTEALFSFSEQTFMIITSLITLLTAFVALFFFNTLAGSVALGMSAFIFYILLLFDRRLIPGYKKVNKMENIISANIFDTLSNITTVIILRVESLVLKSINSFIHKPFKQYNINIKVNEWKWF